MMLDTRRRQSVPPAIQTRTLRIAGGFGAELILGPYLTKEEAAAGDCRRRGLRHAGDAEGTAMIRRAAKRMPKP